MKSSPVVLLFFFAFFIVLLTTPGFTKETKDRPGSVTKSNIAQLSQNTTNRTLVNVGQMAMWVHSNGMSARKPAGGSGLFFPRGSNPPTTTIFQDGLIWGGNVLDGTEPLVRVGGAQYAVGHVAGAIISPGVAEDQIDPAVDRIWRIRRDFVTADLTLDAAEFNSIQTLEVTPDQVQQVRDIYRQDWIDWPAQKGAPFYDADGDGIYQPQFDADGNPVLFPDADEPGIANADQVVWLVTNDLDVDALANFSASPPIGIEQQITLWAYARADELGQIIFKQFRLIYKGAQFTLPTATIEDMYLAQWSDPDLGSSGDDLAGCDTTLSLGFVYNSGATDAIYFAAGLPPPATGYDFFAGPLVEDAGGKAIFGIERIPDFRNLPMTTFVVFATRGDPGPLGFYDTTLQWYNLLRGFLPRPITPLTPFQDPTGQPTKFVFTGDPVNGTGWIDFGQSDRRISLASGPFTLALGDTQETVIATISALGSDRLASVALLKFVDRFAQQVFDNLFELPKPPAAPVLTASELDGEIFLNWAGNAAAIAETEGLDENGFSFEGYNVYQLPTAGSTIDQSTRIATFDVVNNVTTILQEFFDASLNLILNLPRQFGSNSGIQRTLRVSTDVLRGLDLINGQTYYFGLSAYSYTADPIVTIKAVESPLAVVEVVPQTIKPGVRYQSATGDTIPTEHIGASEGAVTVLVTDASALTGDSYEITFSVDTTGNQFWSLTNITTGEILLPNQTNQSGDANYLVTDGFTAIVTSAPNSFKNFLMVANGAGPIEPFTGAAADFRGFPVPNRPGSEQQVGSGRWFFHAGVGANHGSFATFLSKALRNDNFSRVVPNDWEMRFTAQGSWAVRAFEDDALLKVPFELWNIGRDTPDDPSDDYRCIPFFQSNGSVGALQTDPLGLTYQLDPNDHGASGGSNDPYTPWVFWRIPQEHLDGTPGQAGYQAYLAAIDTAAGTISNFDKSAGAEAFARTVLVNWNGDDVSDGVVEPGTQMLPEEGSVIRIITTKPNMPNDVFTFSTAGYEPTTSPQTAREDVLALLNVFPNPYFGVNSFGENPFDRRITFSHLPEKATIRIFNLAGILVRKLEKNDVGQFLIWNLKNENSKPVASGIYIVNIELPGLGVTKNLKIALQFLPIF